MGSLSSRHLGFAQLGAVAWRSQLANRAESGQVAWGKTGKLGVSLTDMGIRP